MVSLFRYKYNYRSFLLFLCALIVSFKSFGIEITTGNLLPNAGDGVDLQDGTFGGTVDLSRVDQDIVPDSTNSRNLGSSSNRWGELFLSGTTINLGGATISSDGTGTVSVSATGVTLPEDSKTEIYGLPSKHITFSQRCEKVVGTSGPSQRSHDVATM